MRILGYIGAFNEDVERPVRALLQQTRPLDGIIVVDNASTENVPELDPALGVDVVRNSINLGPSGAITTGMQFAVDHGYEWIWIFDADSAPRPDALERLLELHSEIHANEPEPIGVLASTAVLMPGNHVVEGRRLTRGGPRPILVGARARSYECDATIWSGSLVCTQAIVRVGTPRCGHDGFWDDLGHDYGDFEFCHRLRMAGYRIVVDRHSTLEHTLGETKFLRILGLTVITTNHPASRRYLYFRNLTYFWRHLYVGPDLPRLAVWLSYRLMSTTFKILIAEKDVRSKISACFRGIHHGLTRRIHQPY